MDKTLNPKIGNQLGGLIKNHVCYSALLAKVKPSLKETIMHGMLELANIELSAQYVHPDITERRMVQFMEWEITTLGSADLIEGQLEIAIQQN